jgi:putative transposase
VKIFTDILASVVRISRCIVPAYCFMPDHLHLVVSGTSGDADLWKTIVAYKQKTGYWLSRNKPETTWQKDFYDHIIRSDENLAVHIRYVLDNPVRKGLAATWQEYPHKGSLGCSLEDVLSSIR